jgi:hypothetical protein
MRGGRRKRTAISVLVTASAFPVLIRNGTSDRPPAPAAATTPHAESRRFGQNSQVIAPLVVKGRHRP